MEISIFFHLQLLLKIVNIISICVYIHTSVLCAYEMASVENYGQKKCVDRVTYIFINIRGTCLKSGSPIAFFGHMFVCLFIIPLCNIDSQCSATIG